MGYSLATYKQHYIIALVLLLLIPCTLKRELKQVQQFENQQQSNQGQNKVSCASFYQVNPTKTKEKTAKEILPTIASSFLQQHYFTNEQKVSLPDFFSYQKEKIPTYLLIDRFLI